jgi:hypothetical protein
MVLFGRGQIGSRYLDSDIGGLVRESTLVKLGHYRSFARVDIRTGLTFDRVCSCI